MKLPKGSPEECNCWMLRRWLQCRGGRTTGKKEHLNAGAQSVVSWIFFKQIYSMVNFIPSFFRVKVYRKIKLIDPDGGENFAKKKARLGLCENISPKSPDEFPTEEYNNDLSYVPVVDYNMMWKFMVQNVSGIGISTAKLLIKGYNFF